MYDLSMTVFNGLSWGMATFLVAAGLTLIFGILHILNFAHGAFFMIGAYIAYSLMTQIGGSAISVPVYILLALVAGVAVAALGIIVDFLIFRRLRGVDDAYVLIATYALLLVCVGAVKLIWGLDFRSVMPPASLNSAIFLGDLIMPTYTMFVIAAGVVVFIALELFISRTRTGQLIRVVAMDGWMARVLGIDIKRVYLVTVAISFGLAGLAGGLLSANQSLSPELGGIFLLQAFGVVIVGGMGSIRGAFIASILLGLIESFGSTLVPEYPGIFYLIALAVILLIRPQGIMGREETA
jgi:branched-chain amino acid transport system permease protein